MLILREISIARGTQKGWGFLNELPAGLLAEEQFLVHTL